MFDLIKYSSHSYIESSQVRYVLEGGRINNLLLLAARITVAVSQALVAGFLLDVALACTYAIHDGVGQYFFVGGAAESMKRYLFYRFLVEPKDRGYSGMNSRLTTFSQIFSKPLVSSSVFKEM